MSLQRKFAAAAIAALLAGLSALPARAACGAAVDAVCLAREVVEMAREVEYPMMRVTMVINAAQYLPADEAGPLLTQARADAEVIPDAGPRSLALTEIAATMSDKGMAEGPAMVRALAIGIFENGPDDEMLIQTKGRDFAAAEQIRRLVRLQAMFGDIDGVEITIGYQAHEADKVDSMFLAAEMMAQGGNPAADPMLRRAMKRLGGITDPARADAVKLSAVRVLAKAGWIDEALALTGTTSEINPRVEAVGTIAVILAEAGDIARAREQYERIAGLSANDTALWALAVAVARDGGLAEARAMMGYMKYPVMRDQAIGDLAAIQAGQGDLDGALDIIADLPEGFQRNRALRLVLLALVEAGSLELAEDYANGLADPGLRNSVIAPIAAARARAGKTVEALATARAQPTPDARGRTLLAIAAALEKPKISGQ